MSFNSLPLAHKHMSQYLQKVTAILGKSMATRSRIGITNEDGSITSIYCHNDGYLSHHAPILLEHYSTQAKVKALLKLGDLSSLGPELGKKHDFNTSHKLHPNWCCAYGRDRGQKGEPDATRQSLEDFATESYAYLFKDDQWWLVEDESFVLTDLRVALTTDRITS